MLGADGTILYIGKAVNLRRRLSSYFYSKPDRVRIARMIREIADIEIMIVGSENESLALEANLIQHYRPPYNRALKREKPVYPYIAVTSETHPRLVASDRERLAPRKPRSKREGRIELGPFPNAAFRNYALEYAIERFRLRTCSPLESRLCMRYYLDKCGGICEGNESGEAYERRLNEAVDLLADIEAIPAAMERTMVEHAEQLRFEKAKELHVRLKALRRMLEEQAVQIARNGHRLIVYFGGSHLLAAVSEYGLVRSRFVWSKWEKSGVYAEWKQDDSSGKREAGVRSSESPAAKLRALLPDRGSIELVTNDPERAEQLVEMLGEGRHSLPIVVPRKGAGARLLRIAEVNFQYRMSLISAAEERSQDTPQSSG
jgi:excinuclease ABC subunit C